MEWITLANREVTQYDSRGVQIAEALRLTGGEESSLGIHLATVEPGGVLGRHPTHLWQLFAVSTGSGWVSGDDGERHEIRAGQAVMWAPGEIHESGSEPGMSVVIIQATVRPPHGK